ncbi:hypothetical protein MKY04_09390 [Lysinibacillus telephonicus]|uniref:hypothetical protein n=1 Tax=Lysinibacillus telephonicus TaxID=1714840 RepID=UPI0031FE338A
MITMIIMFIVLLSVSVGVFFILTMVVKANRITARNIEMFGYFLLVVSLIWTGIYNSTDDMVKGSEFSKLDETLKVLWSYEGDKKDYLINGDIEDLNEDYFKLTNHLQGQVFNDKLINEQAAITKKIHYGLFVLSSLFIAAGRISEVINVNKPDKPSANNKMKNIKNHKRRKKQKK